LLAFAQLIDARSATLNLTDEEIQQFVYVMASLRAEAGPAPVAVVVGDAISYAVARRYAELGSGSNPSYHVFEDMAAAETWITISQPRWRGRDSDGERGG